MTPLHWAVDRRHTSSVACLLEMGAPVEVPDKEWKERPLHRACLRGHTPCVELLLSAGADINARDRNGWTPLHYCTVKGDRAVLLLLLGRSAVVDCRDEYGRTPLLLACQEGHASQVRDLVNHKADVNAKERRGWTPLMWASFAGHEATVEFLVRETNVDLEERENFGGWTALAYAAREDQTQVMRILLDEGAEVDAEDSEGITPLQWACQEGSLESVKLLVEHGADWRRTNDFGVNAVWYSLARADLGLSEYFMNLCGREYMLELSEVEKTFPERFVSEFTEMEEIGQGSFGTVVKAEKDGKAYAVKELKDSDLPASTEDERDELPWEKEYIAMVVGTHSAFICGLLAFWRQGESTFFQMQLCESDLHHWMTKTKPKNRNRKTVLRFISDCSSGLRFLHDGVGKIHRDIKPGNIFLRMEIDDEGTMRLVAKIGDLGLVTDRSNPMGNFYFERSQGGGAGVYLAPEIKGISLKTEKNPTVHGVPKYDEKIDIYSMGAVFFDLLFLKPEAGHSECRWVVYVIRRMLGGKEEKHERPPAYEVEDEAHRWLQDCLQTPEGAEDDRESELGNGERNGKEEDEGVTEKKKEAKEEEKKKKMATIKEQELKRTKMWAEIIEKQLERKRKKMEAIKEKELKRNEMKK
ncbi:unnamed protein product, partial [Cyprideis torosa]